MNDDQQLKAHKAKWKNWNQSREREQIKKKMNIEDGMETYATNLIQKIRDPNTKNNDKTAQQLNKKMANEIQSNICSICLQLMIPPHRQPMILFPCGHNICKDCLFDHPPQGHIKKGLKLKLQKCSLCRQKIQSYALNQSLMALICMYSNNKDLLEKEERRLEQAEQKNQSNENLQYLALRCNILQNEHISLQKQSQRFTKEKVIIAEVIEALKKQKKKNEKQMEKLQQQSKLINKCLTEKVEQMQIIQKKLRQINDKNKVVEKALAPLKKEKEKQELLQVARILQKQ